MKPLVLAPEAQAELEGAAEWYESRLEGLALMQRFPYLVFHRELDDRIEVVAIAHGAREPGYWRKRK